MQQIIKQNEDCEGSLWKIKTSRSMCFKKNSWSNSFSFLTKTWNSPFSIKICYTNNLLFLTLLLHLKSNEINSQSISFLVEIFGIAFQFTMSLAKLNFFCSSKIYSDPWQIFSVSKNFSCWWKSFWSEFQP